MRIELGSNSSKMLKAWAVSENRKRRIRAVAQQGGKTQAGMGLNINTVWQIKVFPDNTDAGNDEAVHIAYL